MYGLDLLDFFRGAYSWRKLFVLLRQLRLSDRSLYLQAQVEDEDYAAAMAEYADEDAVPQPPPWSEWTPDHELLVEIKDRLGELIAVTIGVATEGKRVPKIPASKRPTSPVEQARARARLARHAALEAEVLEAQERWAGLHTDAS